MLIKILDQIEFRTDLEAMRWNAPTFKAILIFCRIHITIIFNRIFGNLIIYGNSRHFPYVCLNVIFYSTYCSHTPFYISPMKKCNCQRLFTNPLKIVTVSTHQVRYLGMIYHYIHFCCLRNDKTLVLPKCIQAIEAVSLNCCCDKRVIIVIYIEK